MKLSVKKSYSVYAIIALMAFVAVSMFIRSYEHEPSGDEVLYQYVWEADDPTDLWTKGHRFERKITTLDEIVQTQVIHYFNVNGRSLVHAAEQAFTDHELVFAVCNTIVFILFVSLIVLYVSPDKIIRSKYILWLFVVICLLTLFPYQASLWTSVNYGFNYLWPATMSVSFLLIWERLSRGSVNKYWTIPIILFSLIFGWTHEGFVVALAGATFIYYCFNLKKFRNQIICLCVPFWLSASVMVFAPGNISRFFKDNSTGGAGIGIKLHNGFDNVLHLWMFWILVVCLLILLLTHHKAEIKKFCKDNIQLVLVFAVAFTFSLIANTAPYSHTMVELTSLLLICKYACRTNLLRKKSYLSVSIIITILFVIQQVIVVRDTIRVYRWQHEIVEVYKNTNNNVFVKKDYEIINPISYKFIRRWDDLFSQVYSRVYGRNKSELIMLNEADISALSNPGEFFIKENRFDGDVPAYKAADGEFIWLHPDSITNLGKLQAELLPVDWNHNVQLMVKLKFALFPDGYDKYQTLKIDTIKSQYGTAYRIQPLPVRKIKSIHRVKDE